MQDESRTDGCQQSILHLEQQLSELQDWKASAMASLARWHAVWEALRPFCPLPLGVDIPTELAIRLPAQLSESRQEIAYWKGIDLKGCISACREKLQMGQRVGLCYVCVQSLRQQFRDELGEAQQEIETMRADLYRIGDALGIPAKPYSGHEAVERDFLPRIQALEASERASLSLRPYVQHKETCVLVPKVRHIRGGQVGATMPPKDAVCDCGLDALLSPAASQPTPEGK